MSKSRKKAEMKFVYFGSIEGFGREDSIAYWQNLSATDRFVATVRMAEEVAEQKGIKNVEGFLRTVAVLKQP